MARSPVRHSRRHHEEASRLTISITVFFESPRLRPSGKTVHRDAWRAHAWPSCPRAAAQLGGRGPMCIILIVKDHIEAVGVGLGHRFENVSRRVLIVAEPELWGNLDDFRKVKDDTAKARGLRPRRGAIAPVALHRQLAVVCT